jgi:hypothetical protein
MLRLFRRSSSALIIKAVIVEFEASIKIGENQLSSAFSKEQLLVPARIIQRWVCRSGRFSLSNSPD